MRQQQEIKSEQIIDELVVLAKEMLKQFNKNIVNVKNFQKEKLGSPQDTNTIILSAFNITKLEELTLNLAKLLKLKIDVMINLPEDTE